MEGGAVGRLSLGGKGRVEVGQGESIGGDLDWWVGGRGVGDGLALRPLAINPTVPSA